MSLLHNPASIIADPSFTVAEFCELERMSRSALYNLWKQGKGPRYYLNGTSRRITGQARRDFHREREADAQALRESGTATGEAR